MAAIMQQPPYRKQWKEGRYFLSQYRYGNMNKMYHKQYLETLQAICFLLAAARRTPPSARPHTTHAHDTHTHVLTLLRAHARMCRRGGGCAEGGVPEELKLKLMAQLFALAKLERTLLKYQRLHAAASPSMTTKVILSYVLLLRFLIFESLGLAPSAQKSAREFVAYLAHMGATGVAIVMCELGNIRPLPDIAATLVRRLLGHADYDSLHLLLHLLHPLRHHILWVRLQYTLILRTLDHHFRRRLTDHTALASPTTPSPDLSSPETPPTPASYVASSPAAFTSASTSASSSVLATPSPLSSTHSNSPSRDFWPSSPPTHPAEDHHYRCRYYQHQQGLAAAAAAGGGGGGGGEALSQAEADHHMAVAVMVDLRHQAAAESSSLPAELLRAYLGPADYPRLYTDRAHEPPLEATYFDEAAQDRNAQALPHSLDSFVDSFLNLP
jgi:hypothetical protein